MQYIYHALRSATIKDTGVLFVGNALSAGFGFLLTILVARVLPLSDVGTYSAILNLAVLITSVTDIGFTSALVRFLSEKKNIERYIATAFLIQGVLVMGISLILLFLPNSSSQMLIAGDSRMAVLLLVKITLFQFIWVFSTMTLRAQKRFVSSAILDASAGLLRLLATVSFLLIFGQNLVVVLTSVTIATAVTAGIGVILLPLRSIKILKKKEIKEFLSFSSWIGVNKIASVVSSKIDVQMLAVLSGAAITGIYSVPARLIFFVTMLVSSLSSVVAPRIASFSNKNDEKKYIIKIFVLSLIVVIGLCIWFLLADLFITVLFGEKFIDSVPVFRALILSIIPFVLTVAPVNAIIYGIKKPKFIGYFSIFQLFAVVGLNLLLIPRFGALGPTYTLLFVHSCLAVYTWSIVLKHYWLNDKV